MRRKRRIRGIGFGGGDFFGRWDIVRRQRRFWIVGQRFEFRHWKATRLFRRLRACVDCGPAARKRNAKKVIAMPRIAATCFGFTASWIRRNQGVFGGWSAVSIVLLERSLTNPLELSSRFRKNNVFFITSCVSNLFCILRIWPAHFLPFFAGDGEVCFLVFLSLSQRLRDGFGGLRGCFRPSLFGA